jgi:outer membrane protein assembly factor BamB
MRGADGGTVGPYTQAGGEDAVYDGKYYSDGDRRGPPIVAAGKEFGVGFDRLFASDLGSGGASFTVKLEYLYPDWPTSPAYADGRVFTSTQGHMRGISADDGTVLWHQAISKPWLGSDLLHAPVADAGRVYAIVPPNLIALDASTGAVLWLDSSLYEGTPAAYDGKVLAPGAGQLVVRDGATGAFVFAFDGDRKLLYPPVIADGIVYVASDAHTYAYDLATKSQLWVTDEGGYLAIAAGRLFISSPTKGRLSAYEFTH